MSSYSGHGLGIRNVEGGTGTERVRPVSKELRQLAADIIRQVEREPDIDAMVRFLMDEGFGGK